MIRHELLKMRQITIRDFDIRLWRQKLLLHTSDQRADMMRLQSQHQIKIIIPELLLKDFCGGEVRDFLVPVLIRIVIVNSTAIPNVRSKTNLFTLRSIRRRVWAVSLVN